jgi:hypothetical protein
MIELSRVIIIFRNILVFLIGSIPGFYIARYQFKNGLIRFTDTKRRYFIRSMLSAIVLSVFSPDISWIAFLIAAFLLTSIGLNGFELWFYFRRGAWWWTRK